MPLLWTKLARLFHYLPVECGDRNTACVWDISPGDILPDSATTIVSLYSSNTCSVHCWFATAVL